MTTVVSVLVGVVVLFVAAWCAVFGGIGALLAHRRGGGAVGGMALGTLLGPLGWAVVWLRTRDGVAGDDGGVLVGGLFDDGRGEL